MFLTALSQILGEFLFSCQPLCGKQDYLFPKNNASTRENTLQQESQHYCVTGGKCLFVLGCFEIKSKVKALHLYYSPMLIGDGSAVGQGGATEEEGISTPQYRK